MGLKWITPSVNGNEVDYLTHHHTINVFFYAFFFGARHVIHYELGKINPAIEFDVEKELKIFFRDLGIVKVMRVNGMIDDKMEDTIRETEPHVTRAAFVVKRKNKSRLKVAIVNNIPKIINTGVNSMDVINKFTREDNAFGHNVSDKPIPMGYRSTKLQIRKLVSRSEIEILNQALIIRLIQF